MFVPALAKAAARYLYMASAVQPTHNAAHPAHLAEARA